MSFFTVRVELKERIDNANIDYGALVLEVQVPDTKDYGVVFEAVEGAIKGLAMA